MWQSSVLVYGEWSKGTVCAWNLLLIPAILFWRGVGGGGSWSCRIGGRGVYAWKMCMTRFYYIRDGVGFIDVEGSRGRGFLEMGERGKGLILIQQS